MSTPPKRPAGLTGLNKVTIRLPDALVKKAQHFAIDAERALQDVMREALEQFLARKGIR